MKRLTDRNKELPSLTPENATWWARVALRLADYEDSGLTPHDTQRLGRIVQQIGHAACVACHAVQNPFYNSVLEKIKED